jgi:hypothetical protein
MTVFLIVLAAILIPLVAMSLLLIRLDTFFVRYRSLKADKVTEFGHQQSLLLLSLAS